MTLSNRNRSPQDEFYAELVDIEAELRHYEDQFRGTVVLCKCDDPCESNFFKHFAMNSNHLGLRKLTATAYADSPITGDQLPLLDLPGVPNRTMIVPNVARLEPDGEIGPLVDVPKEART